MNTLDNTILKSFSFLQEDKETMNRIRVLALRYMFRFTNASTTDNMLGNLLPDVARSELGKFRRSITDSGYLMLNVKQYMLEGVSKGYTHLNIKELKALARSLGLSKGDEQLGRHMKGTLLNELRQLVSEFSVVSLQAWEKSLSVLMDMHSPYIKRAVTAKLRFLSTSQSTDLDDFVSDIKSCVVQRLMFMYPRFSSPNHAANSVKQFAQQRIKNIISEGTAEKRARLFSTASGYESNTANLDSAMLSADIVGQDNMCVGITGDHRGEQHFLLKSSVSHMLSQYTGKKRLFLALLMGEEHEGFSKWLRSKLNIKSSSTNTDWQERTEPKTYLSAVIKYLEISMDRVTAFIRKIAAVLDISNNPIIDVMPRVRPMF